MALNKNRMNPIKLDGVCIYLLWAVLEYDWSREADPRASSYIGGHHQVRSGDYNASDQCNQLDAL